MERDEKRYVKKGGLSMYETRFSEDCTPVSGVAETRTLCERWKVCGMASKFLMNTQGKARDLETPQAMTELNDIRELKVE